MRIINLFFVFLLASFSVNAQNRAGPVSLEQAIAGAVAAVEEKFQRDTVITVEKIEAPSTDTANSITRTLIKSFIDSGKLAVVARGADLNPVDREIGKNLSGDIGDEYYIGPGHFRSAEVVITGTFNRYENSGELWIRATEVGSSVILVEYSKPVKTGPAKSSPAAAAMLNMAFGLGSFIIQKDTKGGAITAALEGIGVAAVVASRFLVTNKEETDPWTGLWYTRRDTSISTPVLFAGLAAYAGGVSFYGGTFNMSGGTISGNTASFGGGVYSSYGKFTKTGSSTIYGYSSSDSNSNISRDDSGKIRSGGGHAVYATNKTYSSKYRDTTAGPGVDLSYNDSSFTGGWDN